jgi:hypothetical protein
MGAWGMPRDLFIAEWQWDETNLRHLAERHPELARHPRRIVRQVWDTEPRYRANKAGRTATHQMIGPDYGGSMWTFCIMEVFLEPGLWRVITGWAAEQPEIDWYRRQR